MYTARVYILCDIQTLIIRDNIIIRDNAFLKMEI